MSARPSLPASLALLALVACGAGKTAVQPEAPAQEPQTRAARFAPVRTGLPVTTTDLMPPLLDDEQYNDKYTFEFELKSGHAVYFSVFITNLGPGQRKARVASRVVDPDGTRHTHRADVASGSWSSAPDDLDLRVGGYRLSGTPTRLTLEAGGDDYRFVLHATPDVDPWRPPQGTLTLQSNPDLYFHTVYTCPRSLVSGTIEVAGQEHAVEGYGYGIHSHSNAAPYQMAWRWLGFRSVDPQWTLFWRQLVTTEADGKHEESWLVIGGPEGQRFSSSGVRVLLDELSKDAHANQYEIPNRIVLYAREGGDEAHVLFKTGELRSRDEPLKSLNWLVRRMAAALTQPVNLEYYAPFVARVRVDGTWHEFEGQGNYELAFLNK
jgi:hypothetical protein